MARMVSGGASPSAVTLRPSTIVENADVEPNWVTSLDTGVAGGFWFCAVVEGRRSGAFGEPAGVRTGPSTNT